MSEINNNDNNMLNEEDRKELIIDSDDNVCNGNDAPVTSKKGFFLKEFLDYAEIFVLAISFVIVVFSFFFRVCTVDGPSMNNTLFHGEVLIVSDVLYTPKQGDVVIAHDTSKLQEPIVKRVIATEGEKIRITYLPNTMLVEVTDKDGNVSVIEEEYILYEYQKYFGTQEYLVPEGKVFVMGDNRNDSLDSRGLGFIDTRTVLGKVIFRIMPFSRIGFVK